MTTTTFDAEKQQVWNDVKAKLAYASIADKQGELTVTDEGMNALNYIQYFGGCMITGQEMEVENNKPKFNKNGERTYKIKVIQINLKAKNKNGKDVFDDYSIGKAYKKYMEEG